MNELTSNGSFPGHILVLIGCWNYTRVASLFDCANDQSIQVNLDCVHWSYLTSLCWHESARLVEVIKLEQ